MYDDINKFGRENETLNPLALLQKYADQLKTVQSEVEIFTIQKEISQLLAANYISEATIAKIFSIPIKKGRKGTTVLDFNNIFQKKLIKVQAAKALEEQRTEEISQETVKKINEVFVPPQEGAFLPSIGQEKFILPQFIERLKHLGQLLDEMGIDIKKCPKIQGTNSPNMMRSLSYILIMIEDLEKMVLLCQENGNRTFVIDDKKNPEIYYRSTKDELKSMNNVQDLIWCKPDI